MTWHKCSSALVACAILTAVACEREHRRFRDTADTTLGPQGVPLTTFAPGGPRQIGGPASPFGDNAFGVAEGKRLYTSMNCSGCHALAGGGGIGPALRDDLWIYGYAPAQIFATISQGRPNGMPSFGGRLPDQQIWQLVAYIDSLAAAVPRDVSASRSDDLASARPELRAERLDRRQTGHR